MIHHVAKSLVSSVLVIFIALICSCATLSSSKDEKDVLRDRVVQMMDAKIAGNWDLVYEFYEPGSRPKASGEGGSRPGKGIFKGYAIENLEILESGEEARVKISNDITIQGFDFKGAPETQRWVKVKGKWYFGMKAASPMKKE